MVRGEVVLGIEERVQGRANRADATQTTKLDLLQHGGLGCVERLRHRGQVVVACEVAIGRKHIRERGDEDGRRFGMHGCRPADAIVDGRALKEYGLRRVERHAAVKDDEAQAKAVRIDDRHEQVGRDGHQPVRGEPVVASEDEHGAIVHLRIAREHYVSNGLLLRTPNAYHGASFAQEEPRFAVGKGFFELGNVRMVKADGWKYGLRKRTG